MCHSVVRSSKFTQPTIAKCLRARTFSREWCNIFSILPPLRGSYTIEDLKIVSHRHVVSASASCILRACFMYEIICSSPLQQAHCIRNIQMYYKYITRLSTDLQTLYACIITMAVMIIVWLGVHR